MSIFNTTNAIGSGNGATPLDAGQSTAVVSSQTLTFQARLTYATFYTGGATFNGSAGKFVRS